MTNSRNKGAAFEREIANLLNEEFELTIPLKRILEQTREKFLPDLILGRWHLECKRYGQGNEPIENWCISPNKLSVTITSNCFGFLKSCMAQLSASMWLNSTSLYSLS